MGADPGARDRTPWPSEAVQRRHWIEPGLATCSLPNHARAAPTKPAILALNALLRCLDAQLRERACEGLGASHSLEAAVRTRRTASKPALECARRECPCARLGAAIRCHARHLQMPRAAVCLPFGSTLGGSYSEPACVEPRSLLLKHNVNEPELSGDGRLVYRVHL